MGAGKSCRGKPLFKRDKDMEGCRSLVVGIRKPLRAGIFRKEI